jgi:hypothetical protein
VLGAEPIWHNSDGLFWRDTTGFGDGAMMDPLRPGDPRQVGDYVLGGRLGAGGMGEVFFGHTPWRPASGGKANLPGVRQ